MADRTQDYKNHTRLFPLFHFFVAPILLINVLVEVRHVYYDASRHNLWTLVLAIGLVALALSARLMALTVQDRVIRMEMRQRLGGCLPAELHSRASELTPRQLVALRFASDAELPDLVREVLAGKLATTKDIKLRVKNWQADWLRA
jgi:Family of unknown function (DUF6526)